MDGMNVKDALPEDAQKYLNIYKDVSKWMFIAYIIAFIATIVELLVGIFAICSRWGSCVTTLVAGVCLPPSSSPSKIANNTQVALLFTVAASATSTALFIVLETVFNKAFKGYGITGSIGKNMFAATWLAVVFSFAASLFWLISTCCCSGRSPYNHRNKNTRGVSAEKAPYTYEPLGPNSQTPYGAYNTSYPSPAYGNGGNVPMQNMGHQGYAGYEPFRHA